MKRIVIAVAVLLGLILLGLFAESPDYDRCRYGPGLQRECE